MPEVLAAAESFFGSVAAMFEAWLKRSSSENTKRTYKRAVLNFAAFCGIEWPAQADALLQVSVQDVQGWVEDMLERLPGALVTHDDGSTNCKQVPTRGARSDALRPRW